jgi:hypothetical protein
MQRVLRLGFMSVTVFSWLAFTSCASTKLTSSWLDENYKGKALGKIMVVGISDGAEKRKMFEEEFVAQLRKNGMDAISSVETVPELSEEAIKKGAKDLRVDNILVTCMVGTKEKEVYAPPPTTAIPRGFYSRFDSYFPMVYERTMQPGYYEKASYVNLETCLYDAKTGNLVWSGVSETFEPMSVKHMVKSVSRAVFENWRGNGLRPI